MLVVVNHVAIAEVDLDDHRLDRGLFGFGRGQDCVKHVLKRHEVRATRTLDFDGRFRVDTLFFVEGLEPFSKLGHVSLLVMSNRSIELYRSWEFVSTAYSSSFRKSFNMTIRNECASSGSTSWSSHSRSSADWTPFISAARSSSTQPNCRMY